MQTYLNYEFVECAKIRMEAIAEAFIRVFFNLRDVVFTLRQMFVRCHSKLVHRLGIINFINFSTYLLMFPFRYVNYYYSVNGER